MLSKSKASPNKLTLILSFILSDYIYKTKDCKLKPYIIYCLISYDLSEKPDFKQVVAMLKMSFKKISNHKNLILHSDQRWQYQMKQYRRLLQGKGIIQSMSRKGNCLDNAVIESFFGILHLNCFT
ncbi:MAG: hypothetical protein ACJAYY_000412 [Paraglaciecola sp.]|jgi:hypothetical protein|uniref:transposase n=1 Tax=Polaribacter sp. TaxID=1920175 RepID=UPI003AD50432